MNAVLYVLFYIFHLLCGIIRNTSNELLRQFVTFQRYRRVGVNAGGLAFSTLGSVAVISSECSYVRSRLAERLKDEG